MDMLKRNLAPLTGTAWEAIEERAGEVFKTYLSARKVVHVDGPKGWDFTVISEGRLAETQGQDGEVCSGLYQVKPLLENRISFDLDRWEMDNVERGAKDIDLEPLEEAVKKIALFEEKAIYDGLKTAQISGLLEAADHPAVPFGMEGKAIMDAISQGILLLQQSFVKQPYTLVVGTELWKRINKESDGYPLKKRIEELLGSEIVYSYVIEGGLLLPYDHEDLEMTIGKDFAIGYEAHDSKKVTLFISESFTFRILDTSLIVPFNA